MPFQTRPHPRSVFSTGWMRTCAGSGRRVAASRTGRPGRRASLPVFVLGRCLVLGMWVAAWMPIVELPPLRAALLVTCLIIALSWWNLLRPGWARDTRALATLRLRRPGRATSTLCAAVPVWIAFNVSFAATYAYWAGPPPATWTRLDQYALMPMAWLPLTLVGLAFAPLAEEIFFRGFIQRRLERRLGTLTGILAAAILFAAVHGEPWRFGYLLAGGVVIGAFVHASRSLWAGIALHSSANAAGMLFDLGGIRLGGTPPQPRPLAWVALDHALLLISLLLLVGLLARVRHTIREGPVLQRVSRVPATV